MRSIQRAVALAAVLGGLMAVCGCSGISSTKPLGKAVSADQAKSYAGVWLSAEGDPLYVQHLAENRLKVASVNWSASQSKHQLVEIDCLVTQDEDQVFVNLLSGPAGGDFLLFSFARVRRPPTGIKSWWRAPTSRRSLRPSRTARSRARSTSMSAGRRSR